MSWRIVGTSVVGTSHTATTTPCQDANRYGVQVVHGRAVFYAVIADGAGSAEHAEQGAHLACNRMYGMLHRWLARQPADASLLPTPRQVRRWLHHVHIGLANEANSRGIALRQFACTVLGVIACDTGAVCFQIGDGAIVLCLPEPAKTTAHADADSPYVVAIWPDNGEYANTTFFVTDEDYADHLHVATFDTGPTAVALMSDGMQRLALQMASRSVHAPFFEPLFTRLLAEPPGQATVLAEALAAFLDSEPVNSRTDDDKTLVLGVYEGWSASGD